MRLRWTLPAAQDLEAIKNYLEERYPHFAEPTVRTIYQRVHSLRLCHATHPSKAYALRRLVRAAFKVAFI
jgi:plasmid stabilization system protein ParE